jgi:hypothetical protein
MAARAFWRAAWRDSGVWNVVPNDETIRTAIDINNSRCGLCGGVIIAHWMTPLGNALTLRITYCYFLSGLSTFFCSSMSFFILD